MLDCKDFNEFVTDNINLLKFIIYDNEVSFQSCLVSCK